MKWLRVPSGIAWVLTALALMATPGGSSQFSAPRVHNEVVTTSQAAKVSSVRCQSIAGVEKVTGVVVARIAVPKPSGVLAMIYSSTPGRARYGIARLVPLRARESRTFHLSVAKTGSGKSSRGCFVEWGPGTRFNSFPAAPPGQLVRLKITSFMV
jgi:hypothetical protein